MTSRILTHLLQGDFALKKQAKSFKLPSVSGRPVALVNNCLTEQEGAAADEIRPAAESNN